MVDLKDLYKYPAGVKQIEAESSDKWEIEKVETSESGEICVFLKGGLFPYKNFADAKGVFTANMVKALFSETIKILSKWYFITGLLFANKQDMLNVYNRMGFKICSEQIRDNKYWSNFGKELYVVIYNFLLELGFTELSSRQFGEIFVFMIDMDNAYRLRFADLLAETDKLKLMKHPIKEIYKLCNLLKERDVNTSVIKNVTNILKLISIALIVPNVKRSLVIALAQCDFKKLQLDDSDRYWSVIRSDYKFMGMTIPERKEYSIKRGWTYPNPI